MGSRRTARNRPTAWTCGPGGVQSLDPRRCATTSAKPNDRCLVFALNLWGTFNNASEAVYEVAIDLDGDGSEDVLVSAVDLGLVFGTFYRRDGLGDHHHRR